jgi:hypothetical protein
VKVNLLGVGAFWKILKFGRNGSLIVATAVTMMSLSLSLSLSTPSLRLVRVVPSILPGSES